MWSIDADVMRGHRIKNGRPTVVPSVETEIEVLDIGWFEDFRHAAESSASFSGVIERCAATAV